MKCDPSRFKEYANVCFPTNILPDTPITNILLAIMTWMLSLFGFLAIIAFTISGIQYLLAGGNMNRIEMAKRNTKWSIIGVIVALSGLVIIITIDSLLRANTW